jgi:hypothetical protein
MTEEDKPSLTPGETTKLELSDLEVPDNDIDPASSLKKEAKMEEEDHGHNEQDSTLTYHPLAAHHL